MPNSTELPPTGGSAMQFHTFCERLAAVEAVSADTDIVAEVRDLFETADADLPVVARFVQGRVFPAWDSTTLDVGPRLCYAALARAAGPNVSADDVETRVADAGDVGDVAATLDLGGQRGLDAFTAGGPDNELTVAAVDDELRAVAAAAGNGSEDHKLDLLFGLFNRCSGTEARYLARLVLSEMRVGVGEGTVRDAIAAAFDVPQEAVEHALQVSNDYGRVAVVAREKGISGLEAMDLTVGRPVQAMLAQSGTAEEALESWGTVAVETKFDGARVQVHFDGDETRVFSRNMEDVTAALPEVTEFASAELTAPTILDGEVVAVDDDGEPLPFQAVLRRFRRKHDVEQVREEVAVELRAFDCLHVAGEDLLDAPFSERHDRLVDVVRSEEVVSTLTLTDDLDTVETIERRALEAGNEGIMLKNPQSSYSPGRRGKNWLKRKPDVDTLDLVVTGAEWGEGRRASYLGTFLVSVADESEYVPVGKVATGITDETLAELSDLLEPHIERESGKEVAIRPAVVLEVGYEEIQTSPTYASGYALRFPRLVAIREKSPDEADTLARIQRLAGDERTGDEGTGERD